MSYFDELASVFKQWEAAPPRGIAQAIEELKDREIVLYGAGAFGAENCLLLRKHGVEIVAFLDKNAEPGATKLDVPVYHPDDAALTEAFRKECTVYISITIPKRVMVTIKADLAAWGYNDCRPVQSLTARQVVYDDSECENPGLDYVVANRAKIERTLELMDDDESRRTFVSNVRAHLLRDYQDVFETDFAEQYFDAGVPLKKGLSSFADCGAYSGDSLNAALRHTESIDTYIAFEPIVSNFSMLTDVVNENKARIGSAFLYPCGVADKTGCASFSVSASSSAMTDSSEGEVLPLVKIDDVLKGVPVTFLKMDIEGAEPSALFGAEELIRFAKPDLAISVYHCVNHCWDIPYWLDSLSVGYKFYLRAHTAATLESVLYCIAI